MREKTCRREEIGKKCWKEEDGAVVAMERTTTSRGDGKRVELRRSRKKTTKRNHLPYSSPVSRMTRGVMIFRVQESKRARQEHN